MAIHHFCHRFAGTILPLVLTPVIAASAPQAATPAQSENSRTTLKSEVRQVVLDVVVTDRKNQPITGLHQEDFSVSEDGHPQQILSFEAHTSASSANKPPDPPKLPVNTFLNLQTGYDDLPLNILLYDLLNTPVESQPQAHNEVVRFLRSKPPGSRFAIFILGDQLRLLQGFTDNESQLTAAMQRKEAGVQPSTAYQSSETAHDASSQISESGLLPNNPGAQGLLDRMQHLETVSENYFLQVRVEKTAAAFADIARFVSGLPGRKNLIWLSGSFPANVFPGNDPATPFDTALDFGAELRQAADLLAAGQISVYPVDIRGLKTNSIYGADNSRMYRSGGSFGNAHARFEQKTAAEHSTLDKIAEDSGGRAFYDTNGLQQAIATGVNSGSNYYTLSYSPSNKNFDGNLRKIHIALNGKSYHLAYRRNYLADDNATANPSAGSASGASDVNIRRGAPVAHELVFEIHAAPQGQPAPVTNDQITQLVKFPAYAAQKKWDDVKVQHCTIDFAILGKQLSFESLPTGIRVGKFDFAFATYNPDGIGMFGQEVKAEKQFSVKEVADVRGGAYRVRHEFDVPVGAAFLRIVVQDVVGKRVGSVEIPLPLAVEQQLDAKPTQ
ncbi:MAG TPA: VWA domain-containing protein [Candidatus Solibacter sp.]|nr:VWA domain-containing protein [Candidatus Solibacter sp.]